MTIVARGLLDDDERVYNDALSGVWLDWDGIPQTSFVPDVYNEVDVLLMHGATPVFISCKSGMMEVDELYKLFTVASRFGDKYARMALVTTSLSELGDKATEEEKAAVKAAIEKLQETLKGTDVEAIKADTEAVQKSFYPIAEKLYAQAQAAQQAGAQGAPADDGVVDADYEVVDDNNN